MVNSLRHKTNLKKFNRVESIWSMFTDHSRFRLEKENKKGGMEKKSVTARSHEKL